MKNKCHICGKEYNYCPSCGERGTWKAQACSPEHYQVIQIFRDYREGVTNAKEATERFNYIGINADSNLDYLEEVSRDIKAIIAKGTPKKVSKPKNNKSDESADKSEIDTDE